jgi:hypothetical protein
MKYKKEYREIHLGIRVTTSENDELEVFATKLKMTKSDLARNLIAVGLDDLKLAQAFGLISLVSFIRKNNITPGDIISLAAAKAEA